MIELVRHSRRLGAGAVLIVLCQTATALADGLIRDGVGARAVGRGGTNLAFADNGQVLLDNPAGMSNVAGNGLAEAGFDILFTDLQYGDADNGGRYVGSDDNPFPMGQVSYIRNSADGVWAFGLGVFSVAGFSTGYDLPGPAPLVGTQHYKSIGAFGKVLPGISARLTENLTAGATFGLGVTHAELESPYFLQAPGPFQGTPMYLDLQATGVAPCWSFGVQYQLSEQTTLGASYVSETNLNMDGNTLVDVPGLGRARFDTALHVMWPQSVGVGLRHCFCPHRTLACDVLWIDWSRAFDQFDVRFTNPDNPVFAAVVGNVLPETFPLDWRDTMSVRLGYEYRPNDEHVWRLGYTYHRNPIPTTTLTPWIQGILEHAFSLGHGWNFGPCTSLDLAYQYSFGPEQFVGASDWVGGDFSNSRQYAQYHFLLLSLQQRF
jgi:long-subunit fatty acid transport protein